MNADLYCLVAVLQCGLDFISLNVSFYVVFTIFMTPCITITYYVRKLRSFRPSENKLIMCTTVYSRDDHVI